MDAYDLPSLAPSLSHATHHSTMNTSVSTDEPESAQLKIEARIEQFFQAMNTQDLALMEDVLVRDEGMVHIGTDTGEIWRGWKELRAATREQFAGLESYEADIQDLTIHLSASGDAAWYSHLLDARIVSRGEEQRWKGARFTGVFEKKNGQWKMVQTHVSLPESVLVA